jgi:hypothetical protein
MPAENHSRPRRAGRKRHAAVPGSAGDQDRTRLAMQQLKAACGIAGAPAGHPLGPVVAHGWPGGCGARLASLARMTQSASPPGEGRGLGQGTR